jgi:hypothetical protein
MTKETGGMPKHLNASDEGDDLYTGDQLRAAVAAERERLLSTEIHSCHADCQRFACVQTRKAVEAEREACAKVLDEMADQMAADMEPSTAIAWVRNRAAHIRARGQE